MLEQWMNGDLWQIFGIPKFWIARMAKFIQLVSGFVILLDLFGEKKVDSFANEIQQKIKWLIAFKIDFELLRKWDSYIYNSLASDYSWKPILKNKRNRQRVVYTNVNKKFIFNKKSHDESKSSEFFVDDNIYNLPGFSLMTNSSKYFSFGSSIFILVSSFLYFEKISIFMAIVTLIFMLIIWYSVPFILYNLVFLFITLILYPIKKIIDCFFIFTKFVIGGSSISKKIIILSFVLFVIGSILELLTM